MILYPTYVGTPGCFGCTDSSDDYYVQGGRTTRADGPAGGVALLLFFAVSTPAASSACSLVFLTLGILGLSRKSSSQDQTEENEVKDERGTGEPSFFCFLSLSASVLWILKKGKGRKKEVLASDRILSQFLHSIFSFQRWQDTKDFLPINLIPCVCLPPSPFCRWETKTSFLPPFLFSFRLFLSFSPAQAGYLVFFVLASFLTLW